MKVNGSPDAKIDADDEHTYFIITMPCHPEFVCKELGKDKNGHIIPVELLNATDGTENDTDNVTVNNGGTNDGTNGDTNKNVLENRRKTILKLMSHNPKITYEMLANELMTSRRTIARDIEFLKANKRLDREGDLNSGRWIVNSD